MATVTSVVTIDTGEWKYVDSTGISHTVTDGQTFNLTIDDTSATVVDWRVLPGQSITTTDGLTLYFRPMVDGGNQARNIGRFADANDATAHRSVRGEISIQCPKTGIIQHWRIAAITPSNVDFNAAGTLTAVILEDQFGNRMSLPATGAGITVAQAA